MKTRLCLLSLIVFVVSSVRAADWKPTTSPLYTRWTKQVQPANVLPEYPRPQMVRKEWQNLNGLWEFAVAAEGKEPPFGKKLEQSVLVPFPIESALSGVGRQAERVWYRRTFDAKPDGKRVLLHFGAVDWEAVVYVNGQKVGTHRGGYDAFVFDITDHLKADGTQELVVGVFDPTDDGDQPRGKQVKKPRGIWYTPCTGIWQTVWLETVHPAAISNLVITPNIDKSTVSVKLDLLTSATAATAQIQVKSSGKVLAEKSAPADQLIEIPIKDQKLWSPDDPFLYDLVISVSADGQSVDQVSSYFGMRKIDVGQEDGITRLLLNGKFVFQLGPLDQGYWPDGLYTAPTDEALKYDIEYTKKLGYNMIRKHVKVEPARWYYWTDKLGMLVWQDMPSANNKSEESKKQYEKELRRLVETHVNNPSIIMWVVFNEAWGQYDTERLTEWVKKLDPTRLVNNASGWTDKKCGDVIDMHKYPGPGSPDPEPTRAAVLGEYGGLGWKIDAHSWTRDYFSYQGMEGREQLMARYEQLMRRLWRLKDVPGLSAAVYTQTTDLESEMNGLLTYDRAVEKFEPKRTLAANQGKLSQIEVKVVVPTAEKNPVDWKYTTEKPPEGWQNPEFDDSAWKVGQAGFGEPTTPGTVVRTLWKTSDIYMRREVEIPAEAIPQLSFLVHHDERVDVWVNGAHATRESGHSITYDEIGLSDQGRKAFKPGKNLIAVRCQNKEGGQYIDLGLITLKELK